MLVHGWSVWQGEICRRDHANEPLELIDQFFVLFLFVCVLGYAYVCRVLRCFERYAGTRHEFLRISSFLVVDPLQLKHKVKLTDLVVTVWMSPYLEQKLNYQGNHSKAPE